jgi:2-polyprenyl-6-methoxyphenol hydroxylase-like FAD-dependent oxidoreductase
MPKIVVVGGGVIGLCTGMLLAEDGHEVTLLERDPAPPPSPEEAWSHWERKGVNQFRMLHYFQPRFREIVQAELPRVVDEMAAAGALEISLMDLFPDVITGGRREGDERYVAITARRPVAESAISRAAEATDGLTLRRGVGIAGLLVTNDNNDVPHVVGLRTEDGEDVHADLVIDATGRRSALPTWVQDAGARPLREEKEDCGFVYYGRHFRSTDGSIPPLFGSPLYACGTVSVLTLPADNGTWGVGVITSAKDAKLRGLRHVDKWTAVMQSLPLHAHWIDADPLDDEVAIMAKIEDRHRTLVVDGEPVVTGLLPVGDSWACTNPSVGRGISIGAIHAVALRDHVRHAELGDRVGLATGWEAATAASAEPWYRATLEFDHHRLAEIEALLEGRTYDPGDPAYEIGQAVFAAAGKDPDVLRAALAVGGVLSTPDEALAAPELLDKVIALGADWRNDVVMGPTRDDLLKLVAG